MGKDRRRYKPQWSALNADHARTLRLEGTIFLAAHEYPAVLIVEQYYANSSLTDEERKFDMPTIAHWRVQLGPKVPVNVGATEIAVQFRSNAMELSGSAFLSQADRSLTILTGTGKLNGLEEAGLYPPS